MATKPLPSSDILRQLLDYDPETGALSWRKRPPEMFPDTAGLRQRYADSWNTQWAGKPALSSRMACGYLRGAVNNRIVLAHRVIWKLVHGTEPQQVDHINGDRADNRATNLRAVDNATNARNVKRSSSNKSGYLGVCWSKGKGKWRASVRAEGRQHHLGYFCTKEEAAEARKAAGVAYGFHANHGR